MSPIHSFDLPLVNTENQPSVREESAIAADASRTDLLLSNISWYCSLRTKVILSFIIFGLLDSCTSLSSCFGLRSSILWPFFIAALLTFTNVCFRMHIHFLRKKSFSKALSVNLWLQIISDLLIVTATVHLVGSLETYIPFIYLFHIVLACIFLAPKESFCLTLFSCLLYTICIALEMTGILSPSSLYVEGKIRSFLLENSGPSFLNILFVFGIFFVIWYLTSYLASLLRRREKDLERINEKLVAVQKEKMKYMLHTTHELKAPFAAIQMNAQLLLKGYCGDLSEDARETVEQIEERSKRLAHMIQEMLQLSNLRSPQEAFVPQEIEVASVMDACVKQVQQIADEYAITVEKNLEPTTIYGVQEHIKMLFINLLTNAIYYSFRGGKIHLEIHKDAASQEVRVRIQDHGIGIPPEKMPKIFEEYYRTEEAVAHNKNSTGLGLAIVRHIAQTHGISIRVESSVGEGTAFILTFRKGGKKS